MARAWLTTMLWLLIAVPDSVGVINYTASVSHGSRWRDLDVTTVQPYHEQDSPCP